MTPITNCIQIVNAVAHRNYNNTSGVQVMVFADRVEVWNSGSLPPELTVTDLKKPHSSFPANPYLANALYLADYAQRAGSGTIEMLEKCREQHVPEPEFLLIRNKEFRVILPRDYLTDQVLSNLEINERQRKAVNFIKINKKITNRDLRQLTNAIYRTASRDLDDLVKKGLFQKVGKTGRGAYYVLAGKTGHKQDKRAK